MPKVTDGKGEGVAAVRAAILTVHAAGGLNLDSRAATRMLRAAEGLCRGVLAILTAPPATSPVPEAAVERPGTSQRRRQRRRGKKQAGAKQGDEAPSGMEVDKKDTTSKKNMGTPTPVALKPVVAPGPAGSQDGAPSEAADLRLVASSTDADATLTAKRMRVYVPPIVPAASAADPVSVAVAMLAEQCTRWLREPPGMPAILTRLGEVRDIAEALAG